MNNQIKPQTLKGFRDFLPEEMTIRNYVLNVFKQVFELFGFDPLETPTMEYASTLLGKYGEEADKTVYTFNDKGNREVGLIYDLTVPVSKILSIYNQQIPLPFKRYQIQRVFRADKPQKSRYREFTQCDIDIIGVKSPLADAEIVAVIYQILKRLGFKDFLIEVNSRQVLFKLLENLGIKESKKQLSVLQSIDKIRKQGEIAVEKELIGKGLILNQVNKIFKQIEEISFDKNLEEMFFYLESFGVPIKFFKFAPSMVRGLDYYTGPIFETIVKDPPIGSLTGGGRYDNLISLLGGPNLTGTGTTIGFDRICDVIKEKNLLPNVTKTVTEALVINFPGYLDQAIQLLNKLRENNIPSEVYLEEKPIDKQLKYADRKGIPYVIIIGPEEAKKNVLKLKNMKTGKQQLLTQKKLIETLRN